jgi:hypothetical protein
MGLNLSNEQIGQELDLAAKDVQIMTSQLRAGIIAKKASSIERRSRETDEVYITAGHKGHPAIVASENRKGRKAKIERKMWARYAGRRKTASFRHDPTQWKSCNPNVAECPTSHHSTVHDKDDTGWQLDLH